MCLFNLGNRISRSQNGDPSTNCPNLFLYFVGISIGSLDSTTSIFVFSLYWSCHITLLGITT